MVNLAKKNGLTMTEEELCAEANKWELSHGGIPAERHSSLSIIVWEMNRHHRIKKIME